MNENAIIQMLRELEAFNVFSTKEFKKDIISLVNNNVVKFIKTFSTDMKIRYIEDYNRFEYIKVDEILDESKLYRYEYRKDNKNIKCIFVLKMKDNKKILLNAFSENGRKEKRKR